jgi:hypothetical protein
VLAATIVIPVDSFELTRTEREHLVAHLRMTESWLLDEVSALTAAQLDVRPNAKSWNIREVVEHLVVVGDIYWDDLQKAVKGPARQLQLEAGDAHILWYGIDRTHREPAIPPEMPPGRLRDVQAGLKTYRGQHVRLVDYIKATKDDLRNRFVERQRCDAYQWALLISTHEQRHVLQIREIKAGPKFPKQ